MTKETKNNVKTVEKKQGKIQQILELHKQGKTVDEIVALGFSKSTIKVQLNKLSKV